MANWFACFGAYVVLSVICKSGHKWQFNFWLSTNDWYERDEAVYLEDIRFEKQRLVKTKQKKPILFVMGANL